MNIYENYFNLNNENNQNEFTAKIPIEDQFKNL